MGEVYRARDARLKRDVALKVLRPSRATPEHIQRFIREARAAGSLNHPNILAVFDVDTDGAVPYVVSELLEGKSLRQWLDRGPILYRKALEYGVQIAHALAAAHEKGICHRDVKPGNVFITGDGRVKLLDFGLATLERLETPADPDDSTNSAASRPGLAVGTVGYMAPEQVLGERVDHRTDIFALGAVLYEMLTGARAFERSSAVETMNAVLKEEPVNPVEVNPALPPAAAAAVRRCLEKNREERFQSARDLAFHLRQLEQATRDAQPRAVPHPAKRRHLLVAGLILIALAGAAWLARNVGTGPAPSFKRLTFQRGRIGGARFFPEGVVYSQALGGRAPEIWLMLSEGPESSPLGYKAADVLAARPGELALSVRRRFVRGERFVGALAVAPTVVSSGAPNEIGQDIEDADWDPSAVDLAVVCSPSVGGASRLEYPIGHMLYETSGSIHRPRVSPDGRRVAFLEDPAGLGTGGQILVVDRNRRVVVLTDKLANAHGLAWSPRGDEVWFTSAEEGASRALWAVDLKRRRRQVHQAPSSLTLWDVARDGRVLLTRDDERRALVGRPPGAASEQDFSLFDDAGLASLSPDGLFLLFRDRFGAYLRPTDGSPPVKLGLKLKDAYLEDLSPDGREILATTSSLDQLVVVPLGGRSGDARPLPTHGIESYRGAWWFPDGRRILFTGRKAGHRSRSYVTDRSGAPPQELTPEDTVALSISHDGALAAATGPDGISLWPTGSGSQQRVRGSEPGDRPVAWSADDRFLWIFRRGEVPTYIYRLEIARGSRTRWRPLAPPDPAGMYSIDELKVTATGEVYFYSYRRVLSELYLVTGLR